MERNRDKVYKMYVTECLRMATENTAKLNGGSWIQKSWLDIVNPKPQDNRTGEEIAADVIKRAGLEVTRSGLV